MSVFVYYDDENGHGIAELNSAMGAKIFVEERMKLSLDALPSWYTAIEGKKLNIDELLSK